MAPRAVTFPSPDAFHSRHLRGKTGAGRPAVSFEFFPPKPMRATAIFWRTHPRADEGPAGFLLRYLRRRRRHARQTLKIVDCIQRQHGLTAQGEDVCSHSARFRAVTRPRSRVWLTQCAPSAVSPCWRWMQSTILERLVARGAACAVGNGAEIRPGLHQRGMCFSKRLRSPSSVLGGKNSKETAGRPAARFAA